MRLRIVPVSLDEANEWVAALHRHHQPVQGHKFSVGVMGDDGDLHGIASIGRPVARHRDDGRTLEVTRCCTDGTPNACSALYGAARRAAFALGYDRIGTYTLATESGSSLRAAGWRLIAERSARSGWDTPSRHRANTKNEARLLWETSA